MKNFYLFLFLSIFLSFSLVLTSCRKENSDKNQQYLENNDAIVISSILQKIPDWLDQHKTGVSANKINNIELLKQNLDTSSLTIQKRNNGDNLIIIPVKTFALINEGLDKNYILNLLLVQNKAGSIKWGTIVGFLPAGGKTMASLSPTTIQNIVNNKPVDDSGMFKFLNVTGTLLYQLEYKNHKLYSWGRPVQNTGNETKTTDGIISVNSICIDWYLVTTYYNEDGSTTVTKDYLWTTCDDSSGGGDGGGGDEGSPRDHNDQVIVKNISVLKEETQYGDEDLAVIPNSNGQSNSPSFYSPIQYEYRAHIMFEAESGIVQSVLQDDVLVYPVNESYYLPSGYVTTRDLQISTTAKHWTNASPGVVEATWTHSVLARYTTSGNSITKTYNGGITAPIHVP